MTANLSKQGGDKTMKYKVIIEKFLEEEIEAATEEEAVDVAWEIFSQKDEVEIYCEEIE
jgi:hypothetical protein